MRMRKLLSYAKSHIYELHALMAATIVVVLMFLIKGPIKKQIAQRVDKTLAVRPELSAKRNVLIRRGNMLLIALTMLLSVFVFALLAAVSPFVEFSFPSAVMSGVFALCEYAFLDQITFDVKEKGEGV